MEQILDHLWTLNYCNFQGLRDFGWCKISSISNRYSSTTSDKKLFVSLVA